MIFQLVMLFVLTYNLYALQNFITQAETMLASPRSPDVQFNTSGNTPGVIGAQEVYR